MHTQESLIFAPQSSIDLILVFKQCLDVAAMEWPVIISDIAFAGNIHAVRAGIAWGAKR